MVHASSDHLQAVRLEAHENMHVAAKRMRDRALQGVTKDDKPVGTIVQMAVDDVDRGTMDPTSIDGVVLDRKLDDNMLNVGQYMYRVGVAGGVLQGWYSEYAVRCAPMHSVLRGRIAVKDVHPLADMPQTNWREFKEWGMRQAVHNISMFGGQGILRCECTSSCRISRCKCRAAGQPCNRSCHKGNRDCANLLSREDQEEAANTERMKEQRGWDPEEEDELRRLEGLTKGRKRVKHAAKAKSSQIAESMTAAAYMDPVDPDVEYAVERVMNCRVVRRQRQCLVRWVGDWRDTWQEEKDVNEDDIAEWFESAQGKAAQRRLVKEGW